MLIISRLDNERWRAAEKDYAWDKKIDVGKIL